MYSRNLASLLYIFAVILFATLTQTVSAAPSGTTTPGDEISKNRNMACRMGACYIHNETDSTDPVAAADSAAAAEATSTDSTPAAPVAASGAIRYETTVILPAMIAGTSLLLLL